MSVAAEPRLRRTRASDAFTNAGTLFRFALRRERLSILAWALGIALTTAAVPLSYVELYPTSVQRDLIAQTMASPAAVAMMGVNHAEGDYHYGAMTAHQMLFFTGILVAVMSALMTVRHTRQEESTGRSELVLSSPVARQAPLAAALLTVLIANVAVALALALSLGSVDASGIDWAGAWLYGAAHLAVGMSFAGVAALAAQLYENHRGAVGTSLAAVGAAYLIRAVGDVAGNGLSWLSPLGWAQATQVFVDDRWDPLLLAAAFTAVTVLLAAYLNARRDVGAGLWAARPGPAHAGPALQTPVGFAWRLHRGAILGWSAANLVMGAMYGAFLSDVESMLAGSDILERMFAGAVSVDMVTTFGAVIAAVMAVIVAAYAVLAGSRPRTEEVAGRAEPLLATGLSRAAWVVSHAGTVALGSLLVLAFGGVGLGLAGSASVGDWSVLPRMATAVLAYTPAHWVILGVVVALFGAAPRAMALAWAVVGFSFVVIYLGQLLQLPAWLRNLSPFEPVPDLPADAFSALPLAALTGVAVALLALGLVTFRRRDVPA